MTQNPHLAYVFPGQGSQQVGMLAELAEHWPTVQRTFSAASDVLGFDLWQLVQEGPQETLNLTENSQPALLTASVAIWRIMQEEAGLKPAFLAGHSLGEWSALVCAEVLRFEDAVKLVQLRGQYMQQAVPVGQGSMAAIIGLDDAAVVDACARATEGDVVAPVNYNSPGQVVIAGHSNAVERAMALCKEAGAKRALPLPVSAPFHTTLMKPAAEQLGKNIAQTEFSAPAIPVVHNVHAQTESDPAKIKELMIEQIYTPVRWVECVNALADHGITQAVECGPGKVLGGLMKRINKQLVMFNTDSGTALQDALKQLKA